MRSLRYGALMVIGLGLVLQAQPHDYMGLTPKIVRESSIQSDATNIEADRNNEQVIKILLGTEDTAGDFSMFSDVFTEKDSVVPLHHHSWHDEAFYIVSGRFEVLLGSEDNKEIVGPGTAIFVPRETRHGFKSLAESSKILVFYTPGGWEHGYREGLELTPEQRKDNEFMKQYRESHDNYYPKSD
jgi:quercetin dioxygenase-like cupin family protein